MQKKLLKMACLLAFGATSSLLACNGSHVSGMGNLAAAYTIPADTMKKGDLFIGANVEYLRNEKLSDATILNALQAGKEHIHNIDTITSYSVSASYGITDSLTFNIQLPYVKRKNIRAGEAEDGEFKVHPHGDTKDIGDISALMQYKVYDKDIKVALLGGVKAPTGKDNVRDNGELLEADIQPGSGSWDFFAGAAFTKEFEEFSIHSDLLYKYNKKGASNTRLGNLLTFNIVLSYDLIKHDPHELEKIGEENHYSLSTFFELNSEKALKDQYVGSSGENTGHEVVFATTGLQLVTNDNYSILFSVSKPMYQKFNGIQNKVNYRTSLAIGKSF